MRVRVDIDFEQNTSVTSISTSAPRNNVSTLALTAEGGYVGFQLSESTENPVTPLTGEYKFFSEAGYPGWMSQQISDDQGNFVEPITFHLYFSNSSKYLFIHFDRELQEYATKIEVTSGGVSDIIQNDSVVCVVGINDTNECTISILEWSKPYKTAKITLFEASNTVSLQGSYIESLECSEQAWNGSFTLSTGFIQQYADITFRDHRGLLQTLSDNGGLVRFLPIRIYVNYKNVWYYLGQFFSDSWSVDKTSDIVKVSCNDLTRNFANTVADVIGENMSVAQLFSQLNVGIVPKLDSTVVDPFTGEDISLSSFLESCISKDTYFQSVAVDEIVAQICDRWLLKVFWQPQLESYVVMEAW